MPQARLNACTIGPILVGIEGFLFGDVPHIIVIEQVRLIFRVPIKRFVVLHALIHENAVDVGAELASDARDYDVKFVESSNLHCLLIMKTIRFLKLHA